MVIESFFFFVQARSKGTRTCSYWYYGWFAQKQKRPCTRTVRTPYVVTVTCLLLGNLLRGGRGLLKKIHCGQADTGTYKLQTEKNAGAIPNRVAFRTGMIRYCTCTLSPTVRLPHMILCTIDNLVHIYYSPMAGTYHTDPAQFIYVRTGNIRYYPTVVESANGTSPHSDTYEYT